jgi:hypothetical protein
MMAKVLADTDIKKILKPVKDEDEIDTAEVLARQETDRIIHLQSQIDKHAKMLPKIAKEIAKEDSEVTDKELERRSRGGRNDAHDAAIQGDLEALERLCKKKHHLFEEEDSAGHTPIYHALVENNPKVLKLLKRYKLLKSLP